MFALVEFQLRELADRNIVAGRYAQKVDVVLSYHIDGEIRPVFCYETHGVCLRRDRFVKGLGVLLAEVERCEVVEVAPGQPSVAEVGGEMPQDERSAGRWRQVTFVVDAVDEDVERGFLGRVS